MNLTKSDLNEFNQELKAEFKARFDQLEKQLKTLTRSTNQNTRYLRQLQADIEALKTQHSEDYAELDTKLDRIENILGQLAKMDDLEKRLYILEKRVFTG